MTLLPGRMVFAQGKTVCREFHRRQLAKAFDDRVEPGLAAEWLQFGVRVQPAPVAPARIDGLLQGAKRGGSMAVADLSVAIAWQMSLASVPKDAVPV